MVKIDRRLFLNRGISGIAGTILIPGLLKASHSSIPDDFFFQNRDDENWWKFLKAQFPLEEGLHYFNNGSLGTSPEYVIDMTEKYRRMLDSFPSKYMWGGWDREKEIVRNKVSELFNVENEEIALIHNTTEGLNLFARSFNLKEGDEVILADHEHRTGVSPFEFFCRRRGVKIVRPILPILPETADEITEVYKEAITARTRLILMVHMTNTNGMILPVKDVSRIAHEKNIVVCVDGAQTMSMIKVDIRDLGCDFYAASGHKWLFGPKGTGILFAAKDKQELLTPLIVSQQYKDVNIRMFEDYNTRNLPEVLGLGAALDYNNMLGPERKEKRIYELKRYFRNKIEGDSKFILKTPSPDSLSAGIQVVEVVGKNVVEARDYLFEKYKIDTRPMTTHGLNALRISLSVFNTKVDVDLLVEAMTEYAGSKKIA